MSASDPAQRLAQELTRVAERPPNPDDRGLGTRYTWRLNIPARTYAMPATQNIPSNVQVLGDGAEGTIRPPIVDITEAVPGSDTELEDAILDIVGRDGVEVHIAESSSGGWRRPHVAVDADVDRYIEVARRLFEDYSDRMEPTEQ